METCLGSVVAEQYVLVNFSWLYRVRSMATKLYCSEKCLLLKDASGFFGLCLTVWVFARREVERIAPLRCVEGV